ncbi:bifunctional lysylphosphatidylglycerol flippase/synthetase MprF [Desulfosarcina ovata]|nr:bifunctional lysylphosphatidylglycerol flippase/synthetase MprF [Desulfosarcina ovata]
MKTVNLKRIIPFFGLALFILAVGVLYHQLHTYRLHDIIVQVNAISPARIGWALVFTVCSYLTMTGYDMLALRYIQHDLPTARTVLTAFVSYAFSNNVSLAMVAGASVRYHLYSAWGLSAVEITQVVLFCSASLWLGYCALSGLVFTFQPLSLPQSLHWPLSTMQPLGILLLALTVLYWGLTLWGKKPWTFKAWRFVSPNWKISGVQIVVAAADWLLAGAVLYVLLPAPFPMGFAHFLGIFLIAQSAGIISQVPGGLGVFESVLLLLTPAALDVPQVLGTLVVYRGIYYLLPLLVAAVLLGIEELLRQRVLYTRIQSLAAGAMETLFIPLLSLVVFVGGAILMFSGAIPAVSQPLAYMNSELPLPFLELSHFLSSLVGMGLLLLARGLQRRLDGAYVLALGLLALGIVTSFLRDFDYGATAVLLVVLLVLLPCRRFFYRRASLLSETFTFGWLVAIAIVLISSIELGLFAFRHVEYRHELWWQFSASEAAPRFLRATVGSMALALGVGIARLLRPAPYRPAPAGVAVPESVAAIVRQSPSSTANLALLGDKQFLFNANRQAFIMFGVVGKTWVAMGDPVGPPEEWSELLWQFRQAASDHGARAVFYEVGHEHLHFYIDMGLSLLKLGEEARVSLDDFSLEGRARRKLRYIHRKLVKSGYGFEIVEPFSIGAYADTLRAISDAWLKEKNTREKGFSLGFFDPAYLQYFPVGLVRFQNEIIAFANIWQSDGFHELSVDLMRHRPDAPNGVMDFLFVEMMLWGRARGFHWFNLGLAPLNGMETKDMAPFWHRFSDFVMHIGDHFYNFQGLRAYKEKFNPVWRPKYLAARGGLSLPRTLTDIGALISGGLKGMLLK